MQNTFTLDYDARFISCKRKKIHILSLSISRETSIPLGDLLKFAFSKKYVRARFNHSEVAETSLSSSVGSNYTLVFEFIPFHSNE